MDLSSLTIYPTKSAVHALREHWRWLLGERWTPFMYSALGDVFFEVPAGTVWWLSTATGALEQVAGSRKQFNRLLCGERAEEWLLPGLVDVLVAQGKRLGPDQCYTYAVFPVFREGSFSAENMVPASATAHYAASGQLHERLRKSPDGAEVPLVLED